MARKPGEEWSCKSCGAKLVALTTKTGKIMPAQKVTLIYSREGNRAHKQDPMNFFETSEFWINHFQTCPHASEHSRKEAAKDEKRQWTS